MPGSLKRKLSAGGAAHTWYVQPLFCRVEVLYGGEASLSAAGRVHIRGMYTITPLEVGFDVHTYSEIVVWVCFECGMYIIFAPEGRFQAHTTYVRPASTNEPWEGAVHTAVTYLWRAASPIGCCTYHV